jgi:hypothetical protein
MYRAIFLIGAVVSLTGLGMVLAALRQRTPAHPPVPCFNPRYWRPIWRMQDWYTPTGFRLHLAGWIALDVGCILMIIYWTIGK